ncbi:MAG: hypothetical protein HY303_14465 [Candidatus Wallbacteria bacterium]|nr:hypothetical protein [Candidatus Wallbacteria bacterium]
MKRNRKTGAAQLAALTLAVAAAIPLAAASAGARVFARETLLRAVAWHLARGFAVEFARSRKPPPSLEIERVSELYFVGNVLRHHHAGPSLLERFGVVVRSSSARVEARACWREGLSRREESECARRGPP